MNFVENILCLDTRLGSVLATDTLRAGLPFPEPKAETVAEMIEHYSEPYKVITGAAVIPVRGVLAKRHTLCTAFYSIPNYERIEQQLMQAQQDAAVDRIVLDIESPGGAANGCGHAAQLISAWEGKPITAFYNGLAASAAVYLSAGASRVIATADATVGAIGCVIYMEDMSRYLKNIGIEPIRIAIPEHKGEGPPAEQLSDRHRAELTGIVESLAIQFFEHVSATRAIPVETVGNELAGNLYPAADALALGLIDQVGTFADALKPVDIEQ